MVVSNDASSAGVVPVVGMFCADKVAKQARLASARIDRIAETLPDGDSRPTQKYTPNCQSLLRLPDQLRNLAPQCLTQRAARIQLHALSRNRIADRSEEHTSELQS